MTLTFSLLFMAFVVVVSIKLWNALDKVERHLEKLDSFLSRQGNASPVNGREARSRLAHRAGF